MNTGRCRAACQTALSRLACGMCASWGGTRSGTVAPNVLYMHLLSSSRSSRMCSVRYVLIMAGTVRCVLNLVQSSIYNAVPVPRSPLLVTTDYSTEGSCESLSEKLKLSTRCCDGIRPQEHALRSGTGVRTPVTAKGPHIITEINLRISQDRSPETPDKTDMMHGE